MVSPLTFSTPKPVPSVLGALTQGLTYLLVFSNSLLKNLLVSSMERGGSMTSRTATTARFPLRSLPRQPPAQVYNLRGDPRHGQDYVTIFLT